MAKAKRRDKGGPADEPLEALEDGLDEAHRFLKRQWRKNPVAVAATVLGVGLVLGLLLGGRR
jgi:hypothetical protein